LFISPDVDKRELIKTMITARSIYGRDSNKPLVEITIPKELGREEKDTLVITCTTKEAQSLAMNFLQAAEASIVDAFLINFFDEQGISKPTDPNTIRIIRAFREYRNKNDLFH
jgi:hypothetical protein